MLDLELGLHLYPCSMVDLSWNFGQSSSVEWPSVGCEYILLLLVRKEATLAYVRAEYRQAENPSKSLSNSYPLLLLIVVTCIYVCVYTCIFLVTSCSVCTLLLLHMFSRLVFCALFFFLGDFQVSHMNALQLLYYFMLPGY